MPAAVFRPRLLAVACAVLSGGCALAPVTDPASRYYDIPTGSTVTLRQDIEIPPGWARTVLQDGRVVALSALQRYQSFCEIEVNEVFESQRQAVRAGSFTVTQVRRQQELGARGSEFKLAASGPEINLGFGWGGGAAFGFSVGTRSAICRATPVRPWC